MFHKLAACCADNFIGSKSAERADRAWVQVYRYLEHGFAARRCGDASMIGRFPAEIQEFADHFASMQRKRHASDYDPNYKTSKVDVQSDIAKTKVVIQGFARAEAKHRRAFSALVLLKSKR